MRIRAAPRPSGGPRARAEAARRHPSLLADPGGRASAEQIAAVVREIDQRRGAAAGAPPVRRDAERTRQADRRGRRIRPQADDRATTPSTSSGSTRTSTTRSCCLCCECFSTSWFRVEVSGIENLPETGAALVVANHAGVLPFDGLMTSVAVHDKHPDAPRPAAAGRRHGVRHARCSARPPARRATRWRAPPTRTGCWPQGELTAVFPEGYKGLGKHFKDRYKLQRFGRGGFVSAALRTKAPIVPCSIVGSEEIYPMIADVKLLARLFGLPYFPITPLFPLAGPVGLIPLPSKWHIQFGEPIPTDRLRRVGSRRPDDHVRADRPGARDHPADAVPAAGQPAEHVPRLSLGSLGLRVAQTSLPEQSFSRSPRRVARRSARSPRRPRRRAAASPITVTMLVITGLPSASVTSPRISVTTAPCDSITESR